jgi:hypothetical protein
MKHFKKPEISPFAAKEIVFPAPEQEAEAEFLDIGKPEFWCAHNAKFKRFLNQD